MAICQASLQKVEAFKDLTPMQLSLAGSLCEEGFFHQEERLFTEGDEATHLWLVVDGKVDLRFELPDRRPSTTEQTISSVKVKDQNPVAQVLGWSCFVPPHKMRLSAFCVSPSCRVIRIPKEKLMDAFEKDPLAGFRFMSYMIKVVGYRFHQFQDAVAKMMGDSIINGW
jgi:CRP-like cAMP-binding protein